MAGKIRQPIDIKSLENYLNTNVPEIKTPLDIKQVSYEHSSNELANGTDECDNSLDMARVIQHICSNLQMAISM